MLLVLPWLSQVDDAELLEHAELIEIVPGLNELAVDDSHEAHPCECYALLRRGESERIALMRRRPAPAKSDEVAFCDHVVDPNGDIWKRLSIRCMKGLERPWTAHRAAETVDHALRWEHFINCGGASVVPDLFEPAANELLVL